MVVRSLPLRGSGEAVADAPLSMDVAGLLGIVAELLSQPPHEHLRVVVVPDVLRSPDPLEQELVRQDGARVPHQLLQQAVLGRGEPHHLSPYPHLARRAIE